MRRYSEGRLQKWKRSIRFTAWLWASKARYHLWLKWRGGNLLEAPAGQIEKIYFPPSEEGDMGESMWGKKVGYDTYELENNGFFARVAVGDLVRVKISWPHREVVEVVERRRRTTRIFFEPPWPDREGSKSLVEQLVAKGYEVEWGYPYLLSVSLPLDHDPYETIAPLLGENARIVEVD